MHPHRRRPSGRIAALAALALALTACSERIATEPHPESPPPASLVTDADLSAAGSGESPIW